MGIDFEIIPQVIFDNTHFLCVEKKIGNFHFFYVTLPRCPCIKIVSSWPWSIFVAVCGTLWPFCGHAKQEPVMALHQTRLVYFLWPFAAVLWPMYLKGNSMYV